MSKVLIRNFQGRLIAEWPCSPCRKLNLFRNPRGGNRNLRRPVEWLSTPGEGLGAEGQGKGRCAKKATARALLDFLVNASTDSVDHEAESLRERGFSAFRGDGFWCFWITGLFTSLALLVSVLNVARGGEDEFVFFD
jgi:hypothetical protein